MRSWRKCDARNTTSNWGTREISRISKTTSKCVHIVSPWQVDHSCHYVQVVIKASTYSTWYQSLVWWEVVSLNHLFVICMIVFLFDICSPNLKFFSIPPFPLPSNLQFYDISPCVGMGRGRVLRNMICKLEL